MKAALEGQVGSDLESPLVSMNRPNGLQPGGKAIEPRSKAFAENSMAQLIRLLDRDENAGTDPVLVELRKNSAWLTMQMVALPAPALKAEYDLLVADFAAIWSQLPDWMKDSPNGAARAGSRTGSSPTVRHYWPKEFLDGKLDGGLTPGVVIHDDSNHELTDYELQTCWRRWLWVFNTMQTLSGVLMATQRGLQGRDYDALMPKVGLPAKSPTEGASDVVWASALSATLAAVRPGLETIAATGAPPPDQFGWEYSDGEKVVAEAELAWESVRLVVLAEAQAEYAEVWKSLGWFPILTEGDWAAEVVEYLKSKVEAQA